jgi:hypothetical protein
MAGGSQDAVLSTRKLRPVDMPKLIRSLCLMYTSVRVLNGGVTSDSATLARHSTAGRQRRGRRRERHYTMRTLRELDVETGITNDPMEMDDLSNQPLNDQDD